MKNMFNNCGSLKTLDVSNFNTSKVTNATYMFASCSRLPSLDLSNWNTSQFQNTNGMFSSCSALETLNVSNWNTSRITNATQMFNGCRKLTTLDLSSFDFSKVQYANGLFYGCNGLTTITATFNTSSLEVLADWFNNCVALETISEIDGTKVTQTARAFYNCKKLTNFGGVKNIGQAYTTSTAENNSNYMLDFTMSPLLTEESIINILNNLYDIATKGCNKQKVALGSTNLAKLTSEAGVAALNGAIAKGWNVT
jgi:surface protein